MIISCARFITYIVTDYNLDDASGSKAPFLRILLESPIQILSFHKLTYDTDAWCTVEICTGIIVVSLPGLKSLVVRSASPQTTKHRNTNGYMQTFSGQQYSSRAFASSRVRSEGAGMDDEMELFPYDHKSSLTPTRATTETGSTGAKDAVIVTTDVVITRVASDELK